MNQTKTVITAIVEFLLGKKYYANIINNIGIGKCEISSFIFDNIKDAELHRQEIIETRSYWWVETISFRSRIKYGNETIKRYNNNVAKSN